jgi:hypothetical protein
MNIRIDIDNGTMDPVYISESIYIGSYVYVEIDNKYHYESTTGQLGICTSYDEMINHLAYLYESHKRGKM